MASLASDARVNPTLLIADQRKEIRAFRLVLAAPMGGKRGKGRGSFIGSVLGVLEAF